MKRTGLLLLGLIVCALAASDASAVPETWNNYYSDYFVTEVGTDIYYASCDPQAGYQCFLGGVCDGAYRFSHTEWCDSGHFVERCYRKDGGTWTLISCPAKDGGRWRPAGARKRTPIIRQA